MFEGMDRIPWDRATHAYGEATNTPQLLRNVAGASADVWETEEHPLQQLFHSIHHQGSTYTATTLAIPFLVELALDSNCKCRTEVIFLLASIAGGRYEGGGEGNPPREALRKAGVQLIRCLDEADPMIQLSTSYMVSKFPDMPVAPQLQRLYAALSKPLHRAGILLCLRQLGDTSQRTLALVREGAGSRNRTIKLAAALAWARLSPESLPGTAAGWLAESLQEDWAQECLHGLPWDVSADIESEEIINGLGSAVCSRAIRKCIDKILHGEPKDRHYHCYRAITQAFGGVKWTGSKFNPDQRRLLMLIVTWDDLWTGFSGFAGALMSLGLPWVRREIAKLLDAEVLGVTDINYDVSTRKRLDARDLKPGQRVFHANLGPGTVVPAAQHDSSDTIKVEFDKEGLHAFTLRAQFYEE